MNKVRITAIRQTVYHDLMEKYENPIKHTCDVREGQGRSAMDFREWRMPRRHVPFCMVLHA